MKNIIKFLLIGLVATFVFNSCDQENAREFYDESLPIGYSFIQGTIRTEFSIDDNGIYSFKVSRTKASEATTVSITLTDPSGIFSLPATVASFAAGEYETDFSVNYVFQNLDPTESYTLTFGISEDQLSKSGVGTLSIIGRPELPELTWTKIGEGTFSSEFFEEDWSQDLYQSNEFSVFYLLKDLYYEGFDIQFTLKNNVIIYENWTPTGYVHPDYGMVSWYNPAAGTPQPEKDGNVFLFVPRFVIPDGRTFGQYEEFFTLD